MKVAELCGEDLDYWTAQAAGIRIKRYDGGFWYTDEQHPKQWDPSESWLMGGPIIERERIGIYEGAQWPAPGHPPAQWIWCACVGGSPNYGTTLEAPAQRELRGPTPLVVAMRAYVASRFGKEVPDSAKDAPQTAGN
jgi:hypothetical protein